MFQIASEETYQNNEIIVEEGATGDWIYVVISGKVEISKTVGGKKHVMEFLEPGDVIGELAFIGGITRTATARAVGETTVGIVDRVFLDEEFNKLSSDFRTILAAVVRRFKNMIDRACEFTSRKDLRILKGLSLTYKNKEAFVNAYTGNVSSGGLFIRTEKPLEPGEEFFLNLQLPGLSDPLRIKCQVKWEKTGDEEKQDSPAGMGAQFVEMSQRDSQVLNQYLNNAENTLKVD